MTPRLHTDPTGRAYALARAVVVAALAALAIASGFTAGVFVPADQTPTVYTWGP